MSFANIIGYSNKLFHSHPHCVRDKDKLSNIIYHANANKDSFVNDATKSLLYIYRFFLFL